MIEVRHLKLIEAITEKLLTTTEFQQGIQDLEQTAKGGGTFCYTFFKGKAIKR